MITRTNSLSVSADVPTSDSAYDRLFIDVDITTALKTVASSNFFSVATKSSTVLAALLRPCSSHTAQFVDETRSRVLAQSRRVALACDCIVATPSVTTPVTVDRLWSFSSRTTRRTILTSFSSSMVMRVEVPALSSEGIGVLALFLFGLHVQLLDVRQTHAWGMILAGVTSRSDPSVKSGSTTL